MTIADQEFCMALLHSETEDDVVSVLKKRGYWDDRAVWLPYGNISNNRSVVGNQQSSPVAALVEKLVNSIDAVLIFESLKNNVSPRGEDAPKSMQAAVERFLGIREGRIQNLDSPERTRYADRIHLVACGTKEQPAYLIIDDGEGQTPDDFPETFLSLLKENKAGIPFVQGKFNMGGTGVLQFAGSNSFQLVISRRQPDIAARSEGRRDQWGFTLVRRLDPTQTQPLTTYAYLAPGGTVSSFSADALSVLPGRYPENYAREITAGTCIKIWNYKFTRGLKTLATLDLRYALERYLQDPALPIRIQERRPGYRANFYDTTMAGLCSVLADDKSKIEPGLDTGGPLGDVPGVGPLSIRVVVFKEPDDGGKSASDRYAGGVFFNVNGQLHSELGADFISRRTRYDYIAKDMIVIVDCTELSPRVREDLFLASRDRMRQGQERINLEDAVIEYLKDHQGLRELNARRRLARLSSQSEEDTSAIMQALVRADPTLAAVFGKGQKVKIPSGPIPEAEIYEGREFPTVFRIAREPQSGLVRKCPVNRTCRVEFETDATNDYFSRSTDAGRLDVRGTPSKVGSVHLWNGAAILRFAPPPNSSPGDRLRVNVEVSDISRVQPFTASFVLEVEPEAAVEPPGPPSPPSGASLIGFPNIIEVKQDAWHTHGFTETSAVDLKFADDDTTLDMFVNMDNIHLRNEIGRRRAMSPDLIRHWFKYGLCLLAMGMLYQNRQTKLLAAENENGDVLASVSDAEHFSAISDACRGLAVTLIPVIAQLGQAEAKSSGRAA